MQSTTPMFDHFAEVSSAYRDLRTTDEAPIVYIRDALPDSENIRVADIGCGAGRYDLLLFKHLRGLRLTCVDVNASMLEQLSSYLAGNGVDNFQTVASRIEDLDLGEETQDCVVTFNAVHHFDFPTFLEKTGRCLGPDGRMFVYTRTPEQNAGSIWGRHFPDFNEREDRLYTLARMTAWVEEAEQLTLLNVENFQHRRTASLERLLAQAHGKHYSTFSLYPPDDLRLACDRFEKAVRAAHSDLERIEWRDENIMLEIGRTGA